VLNNYEIGAYRPRGTRSDRYEPPAGFVEVSGTNVDILVSPHFALGQFLCKQPGDPRYLALTEPLVDKLESILDGVRAAGYSVSTLTVMSGFRTPAYNRAIGNSTFFSRHLWGDAADIYIDENGDGVMDDLNGDGLSDFKDAGVLFDIVESVVHGSRSGVEPGGLKTYRSNAVHGPFVHVDARGERARW